MKLLKPLAFTASSAPHFHQLCRNRIVPRLRLRQLPMPFGQLHTCFCELGRHAAERHELGIRGVELGSALLLGRIQLGEGTLQHSCLLTECVALPAHRLAIARLGHQYRDLLG